jgi:multisubunit Na+/H+ antiporter MnhC subunit
MNRKFVIGLLGIVILGAVLFVDGPVLKILVGLMLISHIVSMLMFQDLKREQSTRQGQIRSLRRSIEESAQEIHKLKKLL